MRERFDLAFGGNGGRCMSKLVGQAKLAGQALHWFETKVVGECASRINHRIRVPDVGEMAYIQAKLEAQTVGRRRRCLSGVPQRKRHAQHFSWSPFSTVC